MGCAPHLDTVQAIRKAVDLVKQTDAVVVVIGTNMDIEGEGGDRPHLDLPGATNQLVEAVLQERPDAIIVNQSVSGPKNEGRPHPETDVAGLSRHITLDGACHNICSVLVRRRRGWSCPGRCPLWHGKSISENVDDISAQNPGLHGTSERE